MRIHLSSVFVDDQDKALRFYTDVLGFVKKTEIPLGEARWLTVVSPEEPDGTELLLEPDAHPAAKPFKQALVGDGIPFHLLRRRLRPRRVRPTSQSRCPFHPRAGRGRDGDDGRVRRHLRQPDPNREREIASGKEASAVRIR